MGGKDSKMERGLLILVKSDIVYILKKFSKKLSKSLKD
jgi:hypothetical protein